MELHHVFEMGVFLCCAQSISLWQRLWKCQLAMRNNVILRRGSNLKMVRSLYPVKFCQNWLLLVLKTGIMGGETKFACGMGGGKGQEFIPNTRYSGIPNIFWIIWHNHWVRYWKQGKLHRGLLAKRWDLQKNQTSMGRLNVSQKAQIKLSSPRWSERKAQAQVHRLL